MSRIKNPGSRRIPLISIGSDRLTQSDRLWRFATLGSSSTLLLATFWYASSDRWGFVACPIRKVLGIPCPSCGMTRSLISLVRGDWLGSLQYHAFGPLLLGGLILLGMHSTIELVCNRPLRTFYTSLFYHRKLQLFSLQLFLIYYILRIINIIPTNYL
jgi:hypothetical protein